MKANPQYLGGATRPAFSVGNDWAFYINRLNPFSRRALAMRRWLMNSNPISLIALAFVVGVVVGVVLVGGV
jgi:hypothetical protein